MNSDERDEMLPDRQSDGIKLERDQIEVAPAANGPPSVHK